MRARPLEQLNGAATGFVAAALPLVAGYVLTWAVAPSLHSKDFPWITARALGIAAYLALFALVMLGLWLRHPWRFRIRAGHAETRLRLHATLGVATVALVAGHVVFLATDRYAGVGWIGAVLPGAAHYRPAAVALGVIALELLLALAASARFAGRAGTRRWLGIHRLASATFLLTWFHGVLAGTDVALLRPLYVATGTLFIALGLTRLFASSRRPGEADAALRGAASGAPR